MTGVLRGIGHTLILSLTCFSVPDTAQQEGKFYPTTKKIGKI
jgi:hypothetical protein